MKRVRLFILITALAFVGWLSLLVGINLSLKTLVTIMAIDYVMGLCLAVSGESKHGDGNLSSKVGYRGLIKKVNMMLLVGLASVVENYLLVIGIKAIYIKDITTLAFIINESLSIVENAKIMGLDVQSIINKALEILRIKK